MHTNNADNILDNNANDAAQTLPKTDSNSKSGKKRGALLLLPNLLGEHAHHQMFLPASIDKAMSTVDGLFAESETGARRYLGRFSLEKPIHTIPVSLIHRDMDRKELDFFLEPLEKGESWGMISDAGLPCIADPGSLLVRRAREKGINIKAFSGPSSIFLSLMLSGLSSQRFTFNSYLPKEPEQRRAALLDLQKRTLADGSTQIFIEAPHRNMHALNDIIQNLNGTTWLCVAWDLTLPTQGIISQPIAQWKTLPLPNLEKRPAIFLLGSN